MALLDEAHARTTTSEAVAPAPRRPFRRVHSVFRLSVTFGIAFTLVFASLAVWLFTTSVSMTTERLTQQLMDAAVGGAQTLNADEVKRLYETVAAVPDADNVTGLGYPDSSLYYNVAENLYDIYLIATEANPYTYFRDPSDGELYFGVSAGALLDPPLGVTYRVPVRGWVNDETYALMERGLETTVTQDPYTDVYGSWMSAYTPLTASDGTSAGALGVDYPLTYVEQVKSEVTSSMYPTLLLTYLLLLGLLLTLTAVLTRPLGRVTAAVRRTRRGEYDLDPADLPASPFPREVRVLVQEVVDMSASVHERERSMSAEIARLRKLLGGRANEGS